MKPGKEASKGTQRRTGRGNATVCDVALSNDGFVRVGCATVRPESKAIAQSNRKWMLFVDDRRKATRVVFLPAQKVAYSVQLCDRSVSLMELRGMKRVADSIHRANTG